MGTFRSYLLDAVLFWSPLVIAASWLKGAPWWTAFPVVGFFAALAAVVWIAGAICSRYGGELGRKLTRPL